MCKKLRTYICIYCSIQGGDELVDLDRLKQILLLLEVIISVHVIFIKLMYVDQTRNVNQIVPSR